MWPQHVKDEALSSCARRCCICNKFVGTNVELHHIVQEADGGASTLENCIPLCMECHSDVGHYNVRHPKGTKYSPGELRRHRDAVFSAMSGAKRVELASSALLPALPSEIYEGQSFQFRGFIWRQTFPGRPNYEDLRTDELETYWMMVLPASFRFNFESPEDGSMIPVPEVRVLHLVLSGEQYSAHKDKVGKDVFATGKVFASMTGHHRGDALLEVSALDYPA